MVDVDQQQAHRPARARPRARSRGAVRFQPAAIKRAGERVAAGARQQILVALAIGQHVEDIGDARRAVRRRSGRSS